MELRKWISTVTCLLLSLTICGIAMAKPDLTVKNFKIRDVHFTTGENIEYDFMVKNTGDTDAPAYRVMVMVMRTNRQIIARRVYSNPALPAGGVQIMRQAEHRNPGSYRVSVSVDKHCDVDEGDENNNVVVRPFSIFAEGSVAKNTAVARSGAGKVKIPEAVTKEGKYARPPDLAINSMTFSPISQPEVPAGQRHPTVGDWVTISTVIKNLGLSPSNAAYLKLSLTTPKGRVRYLGRKEISPLQQNANTPIERKFKAKFRGYYVVEANIVPKNPGTFSDSDYHNNSKTMSIAIYFPADLYLCMRREENVVTRHRSGIEVTVKNAGPGPSEAAKLTIHIEDKGDKTYPIKPLMAKESVTITRYVKFYHGGRTHRYRAKIDLLGSPWYSHYEHNYLTGGVIKTHGKYVLEPPNNMQCSR